MLHLELGTALLIWMLVGLLAHEYGHSFMAKLCGCKTIGFFSSPIPGVIPEVPSKKSHAILILAGGWIFGAISILVFLPFVAPEYVIAFLITALIVETILSGSDFIGIVAFTFHYEEKYWLRWIDSTCKTHSRMARYGLSKMAITDREKFDSLTKESGFREHSTAFTDNMGPRGWIVLLSLLALSFALTVSLVNWVVFGVLSRFGTQTEADFSVLFWVLAGIFLILTITEQLLFHKKQCSN